MATQTAERISEELIEQAKRVDLFALAERYTILHRESATEKSGACPDCGGGNRLHVGRGKDGKDWFFCRQCHEERGDTIEFVRWRQPGLSFPDAVLQLTGGALLPAPAQQRQPVQRPPAQQPAEWRPKAERVVVAAAERLWAPAGEPGRAYLEGRGLEPHTWLTFGLGLVPDAPLPGTKGQRRAPAVVLPWRAAGNLVAVRYRFLEPQHYTDLEDTERTEKLVAEPGSQFAGRLFGGQALLRFGEPDLERAPIEGQRWLLVCEGEINAMSCWQVAHESGLDVLSLGSETAKLSPAAVAFAGRYGRVLVWADRAEVAQGLMQTLPGAYGVRSPGGQDANDLLRAGKLGGLLALARADAAGGVGELERLLWALRDAADTVAGVDTSTAQVTMSLAAKLGKGVELVEPEPGRWIVREQLERAEWAPVAGSAQRPELPEALWVRGLPSWADAQALWRQHSDRYLVGMGRGAAGFYVAAPGVVL